MRLQRGLLQLLLLLDARSSKVAHHHTLGVGFVIRCCKMPEREHADAGHPTSPTLCLTAASPSAQSPTLQSCPRLSILKYWLVTKHLGCVFCPTTSSNFNILLTLKMAAQSRRYAVSTLWPKTFPDSSQQCLRLSPLQVHGRRRAPLHPLWSRLSPL